MLPVFALLSPLRLRPGTSLHAGCSAAHAEPAGLDVKTLCGCANTLPACLRTLQILQMGDTSRKEQLQALLGRPATAAEAALSVALNGMSDHDPFFSINFTRKDLLIAGLRATDAGAAGA